MYKCDFLDVIDTATALIRFTPASVRVKVLHKLSEKVSTVVYDNKWLVGWTSDNRQQYSASDHYKKRFHFH